MSTAVTQYHEEEAIGKTYDLQVARRLLRYLNPYLRPLAAALGLTLGLNLLEVLQPKFTEYAIDWYILPRTTDGLSILVGLFLGSQVLRLVFSYFQSIFLNSVGQYVMFDIRKEPEHIREEYGTGPFGNGCLLARRLVEAGVRYINVDYPGGQIWDDHRDVNDNLRKRCPDMDQGAAALIRDLKRRGLLDETLVVWGGEFGRTPVSESGSGRDHNPYGFTMFVAGGGFKGGIAYGNTDDFGFKAQENRGSIHDLHATLLNQLGMDHTKLTYRYAGRDCRLTDVSGVVVNDILV
jgi:hypothetical protein